MVVEKRLPGIVLVPALICFRETVKHFCVFLVFMQDFKHSAELVTSPSLDVFLPEDEDNPYESVTTAVTRKPCSLEINHRLNVCARNGKKNRFVIFLCLFRN